MQSGNPTLSSEVFRNAVWTDTKHQTMTLNGVVIKTGLLLAILSATFVFTWTQTVAGNSPYGYMIGGMIGGGILALITCFKPTVSPYTSPLYAACQGLALGGISAVFEAQYPDIVIQAVGGTLGTLACLLLAYSSGLIRPSEKFKLGIVAATGGIALVYLATIGLGFFGIQIPYIHGNGPIGIGFSVVVVILAAMNLILDFDLIESGVRSEAPKYMEWYAAFSLLVTLVWLYLEILRLLSKLRSRD